MAYCPIGFHTGPGGNPTGIGAYFSALDAAGRPAVLKSVDAYGFCRELAALRQQSGVPHVIVFRMSGGALELPNYDLPARQSADEHWQRIQANLPPEMLQHGDQQHVWLEVMNEPDKNRASWLGRFMVRSAELALRDGFKVCGPGWSTGEPELEHWEKPGWLDYLRLCAQHPDQVAIAIHEYSLNNDDIFNGDGFLVGRFRQLFAVCDNAGIARPNVHITEWGWNAISLPGPDQAMVHTKQAADLYAGYPQVLGAAIWYLGSGFGQIANMAQPLISPVLSYALSDRWNGPVPPEEECRGTPRTQYRRVYQLLHESVGLEQAVQIFKNSITPRRTVGWSADDAGIGDLDRRKVNLFDWPAAEQQAISDWYEEYYPGVTIEFRDAPQPSGEVTVGLAAPTAGECRGQPRVQYARVYQVVHESLTRAQAELVFREGFAKRRTTGWSYDDAGIGDLDSRRVVIFGAPFEERDALRDWYTQYYPEVTVSFRPAPDVEPEIFQLQNPLERTLEIESYFDEPRDYDGDGIPEQKHEGVDLAGLLSGQRVRVLAAQDGMVTAVRNEPEGYGRHILIRHDWPDGHTYVTWYAHLSTTEVVEGQAVSAGQPIGRTGSSGVAEHVHLHFSLQDLGAGLPGYIIPDVIDPLPYLPYTPPPTGTALIGLHASADPILAGGEVGVFQTARIDLIKALSNLDPAGVSVLAATRPDAPWVVRVYLSMAGRDISPEQFVADTFSDVTRTLNLLPGREVVIELHNEPNLVGEGMTTSWANGTEFEDWFLDVLGRYRAALPGRQFIYPGLSPGGTIPGIRQDHLQFMDQSREAIRAADGIGIHGYWAADFPMGATLQMIDDMLDFLQFNGMADKPVWVTEASNNKGGTSPQTKGAEYVTFWQELRNRPTLRGVTYFVASATHPDFQEEVWVTNGASRGIAEVVGARPT